MYMFVCMYVCMHVYVCMAIPPCQRACVDLPGFSPALMSASVVLLIVAIELAMLLLLAMLVLVLQQDGVVDAAGFSTALMSATMFVLLTVALELAKLLAMLVFALQQDAVVDAAARETAIVGSAVPLLPAVAVPVVAANAAGAIVLANAAVVAVVWLLVLPAVRQHPATCPAATVVLAASCCTSDGRFAGCKEVCRRIAPDAPCVLRFVPLRKGECSSQPSSCRAARKSCLLSAVHRMRAAYLGPCCLCHGSVVPWLS